jgi:hypothetical protein
MKRYLLAGVAFEVEAVYLDFRMVSNAVKI